MDVALREAVIDIYAGNVEQCDGQNGTDRQYHQQASQRSNHDNHSDRNNTERATHLFSGGSDSRTGSSGGTVIDLLVVVLGVLLLAVRELVIDEVVQREDRAHHRGDVEHEHLVVGLHVLGLDHVVQAGVGQQVEDVLQVVHDRVVERQAARRDQL